MTVLALASDVNSIGLLLPWASTFARARSTSLTVLCWTHSPVENAEGSEQEGQDLVRAVEQLLDQIESPDQTAVVTVSGPSDSKAAITVAKQKSAELIVAAANDVDGAKGATYSTNALLRQSPCNTIVLFGKSTRSTDTRRVFVAATDNNNDGAGIFLASRLAHSLDTQVTLARAELETEREDMEVGRRELRHLIRAAGVDESDQFDCRVFPTGDYEQVAAAMDEHDLVLVGANCPLVPTFVELTHKPTVAVIQRSPPLRPWQAAKQSANWNPRLTPADYAELIQGLRHGSRLGADFVTMLSLATVVASVGLLQDSPAVVIGSMLLAPLMTPMIGCGLSFAQANPQLGRTAMKTVVVGLCCTLAISLVIGLVTPGSELTPQIYARGEPTVLDLIVAIASAAAAAYALARPSLVGSIAGVAIATALVPPLCSVGLSLAYADMTNALGAALLFLTNFLAIVLAAAVTFRLMGITARHAGSRERLWVLSTAGTLGVAIVLACVPLHHALLESLVETKPQPRAFPLAKSVIDSLENRFASEPEVSLITAGRPSSQRIPSDVVLVLGATGELDPGFADELDVLSVLGFWVE